jgi:hypothetical protein
MKLIYRYLTNSANFNHAIQRIESSCTRYNTRALFEVCSEIGKFLNDFDKSLEVGMGGWGSSRWNGTATKARTQDCSKIDVRELKRGGWIVNRLGAFTSKWSRDGHPIGSVSFDSRIDGLEFKYSFRENRGEWRDRNTFAAFEATPCDYGGVRHWFRCPACGRRVAVLFIGGAVNCRICARLAYQSSRERDYERQLRKARTIRERLGGDGSIDDFPPDRPKGMHYGTYLRLCERAEEAERLSDLGAAKRFAGDFLTLFRANTLSALFSVVILCLQN